MEKRTVLFVCTGNCCRSQMAEAICRHVADRRFVAHSCGAVPAGFVHPLALATLEAMGISSDGLESESWDVYLDAEIDVVITVCDAAAAVCPVFSGGGCKVHWPLPDPAFMEGSPEERLEFCMRVAQRIKLKIERMAVLDFDALSAEELRCELDKLADL